MHVSAPACKFNPGARLRCVFVFANSLFTVNAVLLRKLCMASEGRSYRKHNEKRLRNRERQLWLDANLDDGSLVGLLRLAVECSTCWRKDATPPWLLRFSITCNKRTLLKLSSTTSGWQIRCFSFSPAFEISVILSRVSEYQVGRGFPVFVFPLDCRKERIPCTSQPRMVLLTHSRPSSNSPDLTKTNFSTQELRLLNSKGSDKCISANQSEGS